MKTLLAERIANYLDAGTMVAAETASSRESTTFVTIRPIAKPGVPREERRYLNSTWSAWEYWDFRFRRFTLRDGWAQEEWDYDLYLLQDEHATTHDAHGFEDMLRQWVPDPSQLKHPSESRCPE